MKTKLKKRLDELSELVLSNKATELELKEYKQLLDSWNIDAAIKIRFKHFYSDE